MWRGKGDSRGKKGKCQVNEHIQGSKHKDNRVGGGLNVGGGLWVGWWRVIGEKWG